MKLLLYSHFFAPSVGGVENIVMALGGGLAGRRNAAGAAEFDVTVVTQTEAEQFEDGALPFLVVRKPGLSLLMRLIRTADVVHLAGPALLPLLLAKLLRKCVVVEHHGYQAICPNGILIHQPDRSLCPGHYQARHYAECVKCGTHEMSWLRSAAQVLLMFPRYLLSRHANANIAITQHVLERHALPRSNIIYYGIADGVESTGIPAENTMRGKTCFAFVGRFVPEKGIPVLLEAVRILRDEGCEFLVLLIGDGPERRHVEETIADHHLEAFVQITGFLRGKDLANKLEGVQAVVMPSVWEEAAGLSAMEQMMKGKLVIASKIGGLAEVVGDAGLTCPPRSPEALASCMRNIMETPGLIENTARKARERAAKLFGLNRMIDEHAQIYFKVTR